MPSICCNYSLHPLPYALNAVISDSLRDLWPTCSIIFFLIQGV